MPIYEYVCKNCGRKIDMLVMNKKMEISTCCSYCSSHSLVRVPSTFAAHKTEAQRIAEFDLRSQRSNDFYKDDRNVGLWARKRLNQLGVDLGPGFEESLERARSGNLPEGEPF